MSRQPTESAIPPRTSGMAITALVIGIIAVLTGCLGIGSLIGLVAIVLGIVALLRIRNPRSGLSGGGLAIAGLLLGVTSLLIAAVAVAISLPAIASARQAARQTAEMSNLRMLSMATMMYSADYTDHLPAHPRQLEPYLGSDEVVISPFNPDQGSPAAPPDDPDAPAYRYGDVNFIRWPVELRDIDDPMNAMLMVTVDDYHDRGRGVAFLDGHVEWIEPEALSARLTETNELRRELNLPPIDESDLE